METLTAQQAKMALEYFAAQAAEDAPEHDADKHMWMTRYQASIVIERQITEKDWDALVTAMVNYQSFDRDPGGYLNEVGIADSHANREDCANDLEDYASWMIDMAYACSGV